MNVYSGSENLEVMAEAVNYNRFLSALVKRHASGAKTCLDFGAGIGTFAKTLRQDDVVIHCVEPDSSQAQRLLEERFIVYPSLEDCPLDSFDYVYSLNVLEHIENDVEALKALHSRLRPGGRLLIYVPAFPSLYSSMDKMVGHFRRYRSAELNEILSRAGFTVTDVRYCDSLGFFASLAFKWLGASNGKINKRALTIYDRLFFPLSRFVDLFVSRFFGKNVLALAYRQ